MASCLKRFPILRESLAEFIGTAVLVLFGDGAVAQVVLGNKGNFETGNFLSISLGWGLAVTLAVIVSGGLGPGHVNPAVSLSMFALRKINIKQLLCYSLSQVFGAFVGAACLYGVYYEQIVDKHLQLDNWSSDQYFLMNVTGGIFSTMPASGHVTCFFDQVLGTGLLLIGVLAITDEENMKIPPVLHPLYLGVLVAAIIGTYALNCGGSINPARDLGPRFMLLIGGWGTEAFTYDNYYFWIPVIGPYVGGLVGVVIYKLFIGMHLKDRVTVYEIQAIGPQNSNDLAGTSVCEKL